MLYYWLYYIITLICYRIFPLLLKSRVENGKEDRFRAPEKLGFYNIQRPEGDIIWFHAASVGELNSISDLVKTISQTNYVLITTVTLNSYKIFKKSDFNNKVIHQFAPLDSPQIVKRFLEKWHPTIGVFIDSELWPNLIIMASKVMKLYNVNARLSDKSFTRWKRFKGLAKYMYSKFETIIAASQYDVDKIKYFAAPEKIVCFGNLKCAVQPLYADSNIITQYQNQCADRKIVVAASTHPGEEQIILDALSATLQNDPKILLIIVPRNIDRGGEILNLCNACGLKSVLRTETTSISQDLNVYIANTLGELGVWYRIAGVAFIGGSLVDIGGHNIIEPAKLECAIIAGHYYSNFQDIFEMFAQQNAIKIVKTPDELRQSIYEFLNNEKLRSQYIKNASQAVKCEDTAQQILSILPIKLQS